MASSSAKSDASSPQSLRAAQPATEANEHSTVGEAPVIEETTDESSKSSGKPSRPHRKGAIGSDHPYRLEVINTLRDRLNDWALTDFSQLEAILHRTNWNLDIADIEFHRLRLEAIERNQSCPNNRDQLSIFEDQVWGTQDRSESHRQAVNVMFRRLGADSPLWNGSPLSFLDIARLLQENGWIVNEAIRAFNSELSQPVLRRQAATTITRIRLPTATCYNRDERLALFLEIAGTDDADSARAMLARHNYDLGTVIDEWLQRGFYAFSSHYIEDLSLRGAGRSRLITDATAEDIAAANIEYGEDGRKGWLIRYSQRPAHRGLRDPSRLFVEAIHNATVPDRNGRLVYKEGRYTTYTFGGVKKPGTGKRGKDGREIGGEVVDLDWDDVTHISAINKFYRQLFRRLEPPSSRRDAGKGYLDREREWVRRQLRENVYGVLFKHPQYRAQGGIWPIPMNMNQLSDLFNATFAYRTDMTIDGAPRPRRDAGGIVALIHRRKSFCDEFGLRFVPPHRVKPAPGSLLARQSTNDSTSTPIAEALAQVESGQPGVGEVISAADKGDEDEKIYDIGGPDPGGCVHDEPDHGDGPSIKRSKR